MTTHNTFRRRQPLRPLLLLACFMVFALAALHAGPQRVKTPAVARATASRARPASAGDEVRALWVTRATLSSADSIARMVTSAQAAGFNTLLVQVRARGDGYFRNGIEPRPRVLSSQSPAFDPLEVVLGHAKRAGMRVHAWINVGLVSSAVDLPDSPAHIVNLHPEWLMVPRGLARELRVIKPRSPLYRDKLARSLRQQPAEVEGLYVSPVHDAAVDHLASVVGDIVGRYAIDGVHLDYVRYPNDQFDYSPQALALFAAERARDLPAAQAESLRARERTNLFAWVEAFPEGWRDFRRERLTSLVRRMRAVVKATRPDALLTAAVVPDALDASDRRLQDWRHWVEDGTLDAVCPMAYATDPATFAAQVANARRSAGSLPLWAGIGAHRLSASQTIDNILIARRHGANGVILFSYDSLAAAAPSGQSLSQIGRVAFAR